MAINKQQLFQAPTTQGPLTRIAPDKVGRGVLAAGTASTYIEGTPLTWAANKYKPWSGATADEIHGILYGLTPGDVVTRSVTEDKIIAVMTRGEIHYDDLLAAVNAASAGAMGTAGQLQTAIEGDDFRARGLSVAGWSDAQEN